MSSCLKCEVEIMSYCKPQKPKAESDIISSWSGNSDAPVVSISCIVFNQERYVEDALNGFLNQKTDFPFEILIHDDASTDGTVDIIKRYHADYPNIIRPLYQQENQYSKGRRIMPEFNFPRAQGRYIALCEGDDFWIDESKLQRQKDFLDANPDYVVCYTDIQPFDESGLVDRNLGGATRDLSQEELQRGASLFTLTTCFRNVLTGWPRELVNVKYGDISIWSQLGDFGKGKYLHDIKPSFYRIHDQGVHSMTPRKKQLQMKLETMMALYSYRIKRGDFYMANKHLEEVLILSIKVFGWKVFKVFWGRGQAAISNRLFKRLRGS